MPWWVCVLALIVWCVAMFFAWAICVVGSRCDEDQDEGGWDE